MFGRGKHSGNAAAKPLAGNLQDEAARFEVIINGIDDGVVLIDREQIIRLINPSGAKIAEWPAEEAVGVSIKNVLQLVDSKGNSYSDQTNPFNKIFELQQGVRENDGFILTRGKKQIPITLSLSPLFDSNQQVTAAVAVFRDVSEERAQEQQRADFISTASHEMRTPVAAIEGYLALALNEKVSTVDARARDYLEKAHTSTQHLGKLFQDLLASAKAEDGRLTSHPTVLEMGGFLEQLTSDLRFGAEKKGLFTDFVTGGSGDPINASGGGGKTVRPLYYVYVDPDRLREVITNIFDNAVKYTPEGKVTIGLTGDAQVVQCYVRDTGAGIPAEDIPHLFQKFYRVDSSATRTIGGTGLGLFITRKIVELYNGRIWVESELGKGSTFYINLPRLDTQRAAELQNMTTPTEVKPS
jgi:PAS domain S-box-containing protein